MPPVEFPSVWLSTPAHLQAWERLCYDGAGRPRRHTAATVPGGMPHVRPFWGLSPQAIPIVYLASGVLRITTEGLQFTPREYRFLGNRHVGLQQDLVFELPWSEVRTRERHTLVSPVARAFDMTFARLSTARPGILSELLVAVGFTGLHMRRAKRENAALLDVLAPTPPRGRGPADHA